MDSWNNDEDIARDLDTLSGISRSDRRRSKSYSTWGRGRKKGEGHGSINSPGSESDNIDPAALFNSNGEERKPKQYEWNETKEYEVALQIRQVYEVNSNEALENYYTKPSRHNEISNHHTGHKAASPYSSPKKNSKRADVHSDPIESPCHMTSSNACSTEGRWKRSPNLSGRVEKSSPPLKSETTDLNDVVEYTEGTQNAPESAVKAREKKMKRRYKNAIVDQLRDSSVERNSTSQDNWL